MDWYGRAADSFSPESLEDRRCSAAHKPNQLRDCPGPSASRHGAMFPSVSQEPLGASQGRGISGLSPFRSTPHLFSSREVRLIATAEEQRS